jgi:hypothetical protein
MGLPGRPGKQAGIIVARTNSVRLPA